MIDLHDDRPETPLPASCWAGRTRGHGCIMRHRLE
jgi:hypothetical protein